MEDPPKECHRLGAWLKDDDSMGAESDEESFKLQTLAERVGRGEERSSALATLYYCCADVRTVLPPRPPLGGRTTSIRSVGVSEKQGQLGDEPAFFAGAREQITIIAECLQYSRYIRTYHTVPWAWVPTAVGGFFGERGIRGRLSRSRSVHPPSRRSEKRASEEGASSHEGHGRHGQAEQGRAGQGRAG